MVTYRVILKRANGRFIKEVTGLSKYAAKKQKQRWEEKCDETYYVEVENENES